MNRIPEEIRSLIRAAAGGGDGAVSLLQEAVRVADVSGDVVVGIQCRVSLMDAALLAGDYEVLLVAFSWCLAQIDANMNLKARFERTMNWKYKVVVQILADYAGVSRREIEEALADMFD